MWEKLPSGPLWCPVTGRGDRWAELSTGPIGWVPLVLQGEAAGRGVDKPLGIGLCFRKPVLDPFVMVPVDAPCVGQVSARSKPDLGGTPVFFSWRLQKKGTESCWGLQGTGNKGQRVAQLLLLAAVPHPAGACCVGAI